MELPDFLVIPRILIADTSLQPLDREIYGIIYWYSKLKLQKCVASNKKIAEMLNSHPKSIGCSLTRLTKSGYITVVLDSNHHRTEIIPRISFGVDGGGYRQMTEGVPSNDGQNNNIYKDNIIINNNTHRPNGDVHPYKEIILYSRTVQGLKGDYINYAKQTTAVKKILSLYTIDDIKFVIDEMVRDPFHQGKPFDMMTVANRMDYYMNRVVSFKKGGRK